MMASSGEISPDPKDDNTSTGRSENEPIQTLSDFEEKTTLTIDAKVSETYEPLFATSNQRIMQGDVYAADMWIENEIRKAVQQTHNDSTGPRPAYFDLNSATDDALLAYNRNNADRSQFSAGEVNVNGLCVRDFADVDDTDDGPHPVQLTQVQRLLRRMGVGHVLPSLARFGTPQDDQQKQEWGNKIYALLLGLFQKKMPHFKHYVPDTQNLTRTPAEALAVKITGMLTESYGNDWRHYEQFMSNEREQKKEIQESIKVLDSTAAEFRKQEWGNKIYAYLYDYFSNAPTIQNELEGYDRRRLAAKVTAMLLGQFDTNWELYTKFDNDEEYRRLKIKEAIEGLLTYNNLRKSLKQENENTRKKLSDDVNAIVLCGVDVLLEELGKPVKYLEIVTNMTSKFDESVIQCEIIFNKNPDVLSELYERHKQIIDKIVLKAALSVYVDSLYKIMLQNHHPYASKLLMTCNSSLVLQEVMRVVTCQGSVEWRMANNYMLCEMKHLRDICLGLSLGFAEQDVNFEQNLQQSAASWTDPKKRENTAPLPPGNAWWNAIQAVHQQDTPTCRANNRYKQQRSMLISEDGAFTAAGFKCLLSALASDDYKVYDLLTHTDEEQMVWNLFSTCAIQETEYQIALLLASIRYNIHQFMQRLLDPKSKVNPENIDMQSIETLNEYVLSLGAGGVLRHNLQKKIQFDHESDTWITIESPLFALPSTDCLAPHQDLRDSVVSSTQRIQETLTLLRGIFDETYTGSIGSINDLWQDAYGQRFGQYVQSIRRSFLDYITTPAARAVLRLCCASPIPTSAIKEMEWWANIKNENSVFANYMKPDTVQNGTWARQKFAQYAWSMLVKTRSNPKPDYHERNIMEFVANRHMEYMCLLQAFTLQFKMAMKKYAADVYADYDAAFDATQQTRFTAMGIADSNPIQIATSDFMYFVKQNNHNFDWNGHDIPFACMVCILSKQKVREWILYAARFQSRSK